MVDKDFARISALELMFPDVLINICHFHINRPFRDFFVKKCPQMLVLKVLNTFMAQVYTESTKESCAFSPEEG